jgi:cobalt/nickel transport protein
METKSFIIIGIGIALFIGLLAVFFASGDPDGLESTALVIQGDKTLTGDTPQNAEVKEDISGRFSYSSPLPDYTLGTEWGKPGEAIAIILGIILAFGAVFGASKLVARSQKKTNQNKELSENVQ